jgi:class 3 adenylate cyclase/tetratricopeptide (TPR) repeat protein
MKSVETVTILFTDLVGSTGLATRIGPGAAEELRREHFALIRAVVDEAGGREVKNTGDGVMVAFDGTSQAVSCAVAVQQGFERRNRKSDEQLLIKIGLSVGDATAAEDGDYFGMPVVEAARLCDRASGGEILAKEIVAHLAADRHGHAFKSVGDLELKGIAEPLPTIEVAWEPLGEEGSPLPLPPRLQEIPPGGFVGREQERERLAQLLREASEGNRRVALISGEPGIGKTRLSTHTALEARSQSAIVLYGRADEELALPYGPWIEALKHYVEHAPEPVLREHVERHGGELTRLLPQLDERIPGVPRPRETDPETERYLLWGAVAGLLREASSQDALVLILDDLHWADKPTLQLLKHVTLQGVGTRALMIGTYRESDIARGHPLSEVLADLRREPGVERIAVKGLDEHAVVEIMERAAGHELDEAGKQLAKELYRETDGNPFYTGELLRHLLESGGVYQHESGRWMVRGELSELGLPQSVREVVGRRIERLGEETRRALSVSSVIGREFDVELLLKVNGQSVDELLPLLEEAVGASVLTESATVPGRFSFAHALINHTLYEDIGITRRARLHRRVADALDGMLGEDPGARVAELAQHWAQATTVVEPKAISYARLAGERALEELAPDEALRWFKQALDFDARRMEHDAAERCDILIGLGEAQRQIGDAAFRATLLEGSRIADELSDPDRAARAALANNRGTQSVYGEVDEERIAALERALELDGLRNPARCARLISLQALELELGPHHERRRALADRAIALAREAGDDRALAHVLRDSAIVLEGPDTDLQLRRALVDEQLKRSEQIGDPALRCWAALSDMGVSAEAGDLERAGTAGRRLRAIADELGQPTLRWFGCYFNASWQLLCGDLAEAERLAEQALQIGTNSGEPDVFMIYGAQLGVIRLLQGRIHEIVELIEQGVEANPGLPAWRGGLAQAYAWLGRTGEASAIVEAAASDRFEHLPRDLVHLSALATYADVASLLGAKDAAEILYRKMEPWKERIVWGSAVTYGYVGMYLGMLAAACGWHERADEHLRLACELQEQKGMWVWAARAHLGWAEALAGRGETDCAHTEAARALELSREHGYGAIEARAAAIVETDSVARR